MTSWSWVNQHHITEEKLDEAIRAVIAAYNRFQLPTFWGTGKRASADGTKWDMYEQNLLAEYHIRYGGYGGIGYYHVSDTYFNHLIANCLIFYNVQVVSDVLHQLNQEGIELDERVVAALSPYLCQHINRFGRYQLDLTQSPPPHNYDIQVITKRSKKRTTTNIVAAIPPKQAKPKRKKKNAVRQMKLL